MPIPHSGDPLGAAREVRLRSLDSPTLRVHGKVAGAGGLTVLHAASPANVAQAQDAVNLASARARGRSTDALMRMLTGGEALDIDGPVTAPPVPRPASRDLKSQSAYLSMDQFSRGTARHTGGATGSVAVARADDPDSPMYQLKFSAREGTSVKAFLRREKAGGLDSENLSEMIGSSVARSISKALVASEGRSGGAQTPGARAAASDRLPTVSLVLDSQTGRTAVASRYLDITGDLDKRYKADTQATHADRHVRIERARHADATPALPGHWRPNATQARQVCDVLAMSALLGDHDVNPGNLVELKDGSIGRIDFGHAFNDLITGLGGTRTGGGGVRDPGGNRIRDYFNRSTISHIQSAHQIPKVWRDYKGFVPSETLGDALLAVADKKNDAVLGLTQASVEILALVETLAKSAYGRQRHEALHLAHSIEAIAAKCSVADVNYKPIASQVKNPFSSKPPDPHKMISDALVHLSRFVEEGHRQMTNVGVACKLQGMVKAWREGEWTGNRASLQAACQNLLSSHGLEPYEGLPWLRVSLDEKPFEGSFLAYMDAQGV